MRHRWVTSVLALHIPILALWSCIREVNAGTFGWLSLPVALLLLARGGIRMRVPQSDLGQHLASAAGAAGLMSCACYLVAISGGYIEAHFHFFVLVMVVALYEAWIPFAVAIGIVLVEHGVVGTVWPHAVFGREMMHMEHPWRFACIHAAFVLLASLVSLVTWRLAELSRMKELVLLEQLHYSATHDHLTDLPNRGAFVKAVQRELRSNVEEPVAVMLVGLEGFDEINDTLGHAAGDEILRAVGGNLGDAVHACAPGATVAKLDGSQYAVLLPGHDSARARARAEAFTEAVTAIVDVLGVQVGVGASIGVTHAPPQRIRDWEDVAERDAVLLVQQASVAMFRARDARSGVAGYDASIDDMVRSRLRTLSEFRRALAADDQIVLHYQPKFSLADDRLVGVEALARWEHPTRGLLPPGQFVELATNTQHAEQFTRLVLDSALRQAARWQRAGFEVPVAVNITPQCLLRPVFVLAVLELLQVHDVPPALLRLEITEDAIVQDPAAAAEVLDDLRRLGLNVSIDDFGTGFSSLSYLRHLRVDELKIDRSFVTDLVPSTGDAVSLMAPSPDQLLVSTIIGLAHGLGMAVVAEGIETQDQTDVLRAAGCDVAQGFHYSRPVPASEITARLRAGSWTPAMQQVPHLSVVPKPLELL